VVDEESSRCLVGLEKILVVVRAGRVCCARQVSVRVWMLWGARESALSMQWCVGKKKKLASGKWKGKILKIGRDLLPSMSQLESA
jgi:hypothetical protein